ncbi:MAG: amidohydrolase family protein [Betaproteobacteria bacterium]|nr:amidohydrolase family protein [Betaproteobacteria bacterium]
MSDLNEPKIPVDQPCAAPDLNPRRPSIAVPPGACDCHAHIFGDPARYPYKTVRRYTPSAASVDDYRHMLKVLGIERAVIVQTGIFHGNDVTYDVLQESNGKWRGIALLDGGVTTQEIARLNDAGFRGVRLNPRNVKADDLKDMEIIAQKIAPFGWHLQFHLDARDLVTLADRLRRLPVEIVVDHLGHMPVDAGVDHPGFHELLAMLHEGRCWVKLSSPNRFGDPRPPYPSVLPYARALVEAAPDRCVWATDWPHSRFAGFMPNDGDLLDLLATWVPDAGVRKKILVDNPARLYGFAK